jgi:ribosomal protein S18 acetylase RimI-like enzyme
MSETSTLAGPAVKPLDAALDEGAGDILAAATFEGTAEAGRSAVAAARIDPNALLFGVFEDGTLVGVYLLRKAPMMNEIPLLAIAPEYRRRGFGRMCLHDALFRSGRRPLVVETDEAALAFYKAVGFKLVGKRKGLDGSPRYRLGWHAPIPHPEQPGKVIC